MSSYRCALSVIKWVGVIIALLSNGSSARAQATYPLVCRAGGRMALLFYSDRTSSNPGFNTVGVTFEKASDPSNIQPGQCSWADRPLNWYEPDIISYKDTSATRAFVRSDSVAIISSNGDSDIQHLLLLAGTVADPNKYYTFYVYNWENAFMTKPGFEPVK